MIRDITIGQYYPADSPLHKMDPRVKLFATVIYVIALFCFNCPVFIFMIPAFAYTSAYQPTLFFYKESHHCTH